MIMRRINSYTKMKSFLDISNTQERKAKEPPSPSWDDFFIFVDIEKDWANETQDSLDVDCDILLFPTKGGVKYNEP